MLMKLRMEEIAKYKNWSFKNINQIADFQLD